MSSLILETELRRVALHIAAAVKVNADLMPSYDSRQTAAAEAAGLRTLSLA